MKMGGNLAVLDGEKSYRRNKATGQKASINYEDGQCFMCTRVPSKESEVREEANRFLKATGLRFWPRRVRRLSAGRRESRKTVRRRSSSRDA